MRSTHARLPQLKAAQGEAIYRLNWLRACRWRANRLEIQAVFVPEETSRALPVLRPWIRASDFPLLILNSRWYRGVMVGKPLGLRRLVIKNARVVKVHGVAQDPTPGKITLGPAYRVNDPGGNTPVLEFEGSDESDSKERLIRIFLPLSEAYRSHYLNVPLAIPGILAGLITGSLSNPAFMAWDPDGTGWIDETAREARITPHESLPQGLTKRLARLIFAAPGEQALRKIHRWVQATFVAPTADSKGKSKPWLPVVPLPYHRAVWDASVVALPDDEEGRPQVLVLHLESFDAPEPFNELEIVVPPRVEGGNGDDDGPRPGGGKLLDPDPDDPVNDVDEGWDPRLEPVAIDDVVARDERVQRRRPRVVRPDPLPGDGGRRGGREDVPVTEGSTQGSGDVRRGAAPLVYPDGDPTVERNPSLDASHSAIRRALEIVVARHRQKNIDAAARFLPSEDRVFRFLVPASDSAHARRVVVGRQFLVAEVRVCGRYAYVIEPERRSEHQPLPLGVAYLTGNDGHARQRSFDTDRLEHIVHKIETAARLGHSWPRLAAEDKNLAVEAVVHPPGSPPSDDALERFSERIASKLLKAIGDAAVVS